MSERELLDAMEEAQRKAVAFELICEAEGMSVADGIAFAENHPGRRKP